MCLYVMKPGISFCITFYIFVYMYVYISIGNEYTSQCSDYDIFYSTTGKGDLNFHQVVLGLYIYHLRQYS